MQKSLLLLAFLFVSFRSFSQSSLNNDPLHTPEEVEGISYYFKGSEKFFKRDYVGAIEELTKAIELIPTHYRAYQFRASCKEALDDYIGALRDYNEAINIIPQDYSNYQHRGDIKFYLEDYRGALLDYNKGIDLHATPGGYCGRAKIKNALKDYVGGIKDCNLAIQGYPKYDSAHYQRGIAKWYIGDKEGACLDWSKAGEYGADYAYDTIKQFCN